MGGLVAIAAILGTAAGLDGKQLAGLDLVGRMALSVHRLGGEDEIAERSAIDPGGVFTRPVHAGLCQKVDIAEQCDHERSVPENDKGT